MNQLLVDGEDMDVIIEGMRFTLQRDYDLAQLRRLSLEGRIEWLRRRVNYVVLTPLRLMMPAKLGELLWSKDCNGVMLLVTLIALSIEALSQFAFPGLQGDRFNKFCMRFLFSSQLKNRSDRLAWLWQKVRNGLVHNLAILEGGIELRRGHRYCFRRTQHGVEMDPTVFLDRFDMGCKRFFANLAKHPRSAMRITFAETFERRLILGDHHP